MSLQAEEPRLGTAAPPSADAPGAAPAARAGRRTPRRYGPVAAAFLLPFFALFAVFFVGPVLYAVWNSLHGVKRSGLGFGGGTVEYVGLANYARVLQDESLRRGLLRMLLLMVVQVPVMIALATVLALLFDSTVARLRRLFQTVAFVPYAIPGVIAAILWAFLYLPGVSPVVDLLQRLGLPADFLSADAVLWSIANMVTWQWTGYNMLIVFAALQAIPADIYEAARVDGAGGVSIALRVKLPIIRPALVLTAVFSIIGTLQLFAEPQVLRSLTANITSTYTPNMAAYAAAFDGNDAYYAAALSVCLALVTFLGSYGFLKIAQRTGDV